MNSGSCFGIMRTSRPHLTAQAGWPLPAGPSCWQRRSTADTRQDCKPSQTVSAMGEVREAAQGTLRQTCKTASLAVTTAAERQRAVRSQTQPAEDWQISGHRLRRSPHLGEFDPRGQIPPQRLFSFGPCTARFLFSAQPKRENGGCNEPAILMAALSFAPESPSRLRGRPAPP